MNKRSELIGACLFVLLMALPAQGGLGDLLDPPPVESEGLGELVALVVAPVVETVETVVAPVTEVVTETVETTTGTVIVPIVEVVAQTVETTIDTVDETTEILTDVGRETPPVETPPIVILDGRDLPETKPGFSPVPTESTDRQIPARPVTLVTGPTGPQVGAADPVPNATVVRALLTSLTSAPGVEVPEGSIGADLSLNAANPVDSGWLFFLSSWLGAGISALLDVLSIPMRLLELLFRALTSSGAGLLAPASLLLSLAVGGRRRLLTIA